MLPQPKFGIVGAIVSLGLVGGCGESPRELHLDSPDFVWRYLSPYLFHSDAKVTVDSLSVFESGGQIFVFYLVGDRGSDLDRLRLLRLSTSKGRVQATPVMDDLEVAHVGRSGVYPIRGASSTSGVPVVIAKTLKDPGKSSWPQWVNLATIDASGKTRARTAPVRLLSLRFVTSAWQSPDGRVLLVGYAKGERYGTLGLVALGRNGKRLWSYVAKGFAGKKPYLSGTGLYGNEIVSGRFKEDGTFVIIGHDGHWNNGKAVRYLYRLEVNRDGQKVSFKSILNLPPSAITTNSPGTFPVRFRPLLSHVRRKPGGGFVGLFKGWYQNEQRALRIISIAKDGRIQWVRGTSSEKKAKYYHFGVSRAGRLLAGFLGADGKSRLFLYSRKGELVSSYIAQGLSIRKTQPHPVAGFLLTAIHTNKKKEQRLVLLHFRPR
jgi:hypothetical protein